MALFQMPWLFRYLKSASVTIYLNGIHQDKKGNIFSNTAASVIWCL